MRGRLVLRRGGVWDEHHKRMPIFGHDDAFARCVDIIHKLAETVADFGKVERLHVFFLRVRQQLLHKTGRMARDIALISARTGEKFVGGNDADAAVIGGMLRVTTDRACTYTDANGETVFCFPLLSVLDG